MIKVKEDLTGRKFGRWKVIKQAEDHIGKSGKSKIAYWVVQCSCDKGTISEVSGCSLKRGESKSCGCLKSEIITKIKNNQIKFNTYDLTGEYGIDYDSDNKEFYFDLEDYDKIKSLERCWKLDNKDYVYAKHKDRRIGLHRYLMDIDDPNIIVDHRDRKPNNNRKYNLRVADKPKNAFNRKLNSNNISGVTGVHFHEKKNKWVAKINANSLELRESFDLFDDAVEQRKIWEKEYHKEYSNGRLE